jgi:hypothetical protein
MLWMGQPNVLFGRSEARSGSPGVWKKHHSQALLTQVNDSEITERIHGHSRKSMSEGKVETTDWAYITQGRQPFAWGMLDFYVPFKG